MKVKEESEKAGLQLNIQETKIMASGPIISWQIDGEIMETVTDSVLGGSKITADGDCSHEIKRRLLLGRKAMINLLLLLLSRFSRVRLYAAPQTAAHQAPQSLGFSRQEYWSELPFPSLLLLLLSHFSRVRLCGTLQTAAHQAPPSLGFSRQEHWSGLPFPSPVHENEKSK